MSGVVEAQLNIDTEYVSVRIEKHRMEIDFFSWLTIFVFDS